MSSIKPFHSVLCRSDWHKQTAEIDLGLTLKPAKNIDRRPNFAHICNRRFFRTKLLELYQPFVLNRTYQPLLDCKDYEGEELANQPAKNCPNRLVPLIVELF